MAKLDYYKGVRPPFSCMGRFEHKATPEMVAFYNGGDVLTSENRQALHEYVKYQIDLAEADRTAHGKKPDHVLDETYNKALLDSFVNINCICPVCDAWMKITAKECPVCGEKHVPKEKQNKIEAEKIKEKKKEVVPEPAIILNDKEASLTFEGFIGKVDQYVNVRAAEGNGSKSSISSYDLLEKLKSFPMPNEADSLKKFANYFVERLEDQRLNSSLKQIFLTHIKTCKRRIEMDFSSDTSFTPLLNAINEVISKLEAQKDSINKTAIAFFSSLFSFCIFGVLIFLGVMLGDKASTTIMFWLLAVVFAGLVIWFLHSKKALSKTAYTIWTVLAALVFIALGLAAQNFAYMLGAVVVFVVSVFCKKKLFK